MFVDIENFKSPLAIENILSPYKKGRLAPDKKSYLPKEPITPQVCMDILKSTNYARNIKDMLLCIADLPPSEQAQFKDVVLTTFTQREHSNDMLVLGKKLAHASGYEAELAEAQKIKEGTFLLSGSKYSKAFVSFESYFRCVNFPSFDKLLCLNEDVKFYYQNFRDPIIIEFPNANKVSFIGSNLSSLQGMHFKDGAEVDFSNAKNLPAHLDVSQCSNINFTNCNLSEQSGLRFRDDAIVSLNGAKQLPANLDFSKSESVDLGYCDLANQPNLRFKDGAMVFLTKPTNIPHDLDVSMCSKVHLTNCDLKSLSGLSFKENAVVWLDHDTNLPSQLDFSQCAEVSLRDCDLSNLHNLCFKEDAKVFLIGAKNLSGNIDVSMCSEVNLSSCSMKNVERIVFKNRKQMMNSFVRFPVEWTGKAFFADKRPQADLNSAMMQKPNVGR